MTRSHLVATVLLLGSAWAPVARAQDAPAPAVATDQLAEQALGHMQGGDWEAALASLDRVQDPSPSIGLYRARCLAALGRLRAAQDQLRAVTALELGADAPPAFALAQRQARSELAALEPRLPVIAVELDGEQWAEAEVSIDGVALAPGQSRQVVDPGTHEVVVEAEGERATRSVETAEGQTVRMRLGDPGPRQRLNRGSLYWGVGLGAVSLGLTASFVWATVRLDSIRDDPGYVAFTDNLRPAGADACDAAQNGTPGVDYLVTPTSHSRSTMVQACGDADRLQTLQVVAIPSALVTGTLAAFLLAHVVEDAPQIGLAPIVGPTTAGATLRWSF